ncbi:MAG: hypothetical protein R3236_11010, partial [Phycisphaeraceae bacterium]|nr:hypothetical protein [Phycisphaeraceae bacterium]
KRHLFGAYDQLIDCVSMAGRIVDSAHFDHERIGRDLDRGFLDATALAEYLVVKKVPFRTAHQHVGKMVRACEEQGLRGLSDLSIEQMQQICPQVEPDVSQWLGAANVVRRYQSAGNAGSGYQKVLADWKQRLEGEGPDEQAAKPS